MNPTRPSILAVFILTVFVFAYARVSAAPVVYESFNYGATGGAINGTTATGTGLTGTYVTTTVGTGASSNYVPTSLTFSSSFAPSQGGALQLSLTPASGSLNENAISGVQLNAGTLTSTVWASYLFNLSSNSIDQSADAIFSSLADTQNTSSNRRIGMYGDSGNSGNNMAVTYDASSGSQSPTSGTLVLTLNTTYLMLGRWDNVGAAGGGTATMWILTASNYDTWLLNGAAEAGLNTYATGWTQKTVTTQIFFNNSTYLQFAVAEGGTTGAGTLTGTFDEFRFGSDLSSVAAVVPEPGVPALLLGGFGLLCLRRRTRERAEAGGLHLPSLIAGRIRDGGPSTFCHLTVT